MIVNDINEVVKKLQTVPFLLDELEFDCDNKTQMKHKGEDIQKFIMGCRNELFQISTDVRTFRKSLMTDQEKNEAENKKLKRIAELEAELASLR